MDASATVATWLNLGVTLVGLGSIINQFSTILDQTDPFHTMRDAQHLGICWKRQPRDPWYQIVKQPPVGPDLYANILRGLCEKKTVYLGRLPLSQAHSTCQTAWSIILALIHPASQPNSSQIMSSKAPSINAAGEVIVTISRDSSQVVSNEPWDNLRLLPLVKHHSSPCVPISRTCLIALLCLTNAKRVFCHNSASGHRAAYPSYCGLWRVEWPIGDIARVYFDPLDTATFPEDKYPKMFEQRVDKCLLMLAGVVDSQTSNSLKWRKAHGKWLLEYAVNAFGGAHSGKGLYNQIGGSVDEVDFLRMKPMDEGKVQPEYIVLQLPSTQSSSSEVTLYVPPRESAILNEALDRLPWTFLPWSIHRGLRDILVAFAKKRMDSFRESLAATLCSVVEAWPERLENRGWNSDFVRKRMADVARSSVMAGQGTSGDAVRVVTDIAVVSRDNDLDISALDETTFWRDTTSEPPSSLSPMALVALVKCFVLEWSNELDYTLYHDLPLKVYLG
ncbi:unnamed protein product [Penicillium pancosmium]